MTMRKYKRQMSVIGHVGKQPLRSATPGGMSVIDFSVASIYSRKNGDAYEDHTEWTQCKIKGDRRCDTFMKHVGKGTYIEVEGHFRTEKYQDKNSGETRYKNYIIVDTYTPFTKVGNSQSSQDDLNIPTQ